jgi:predicted protein tyrosine phosphatase
MSEHRHNEPTHILFICNAALQRSPTAAALFRDSEQYEARAAGIDPFATTRISQWLIDWADMIFVMSEREDHHHTFLREHFLLGETPVYDLDISDRYYRDQKELLDLLYSRLSRYVTVPTKQ